MKEVIIGGLEYQPQQPLGVKRGHLQQVKIRLMGSEGKNEIH